MLDVPVEIGSSGGMLEMAAIRLMSTTSDFGFCDDILYSDLLLGEKKPIILLRSTVVVRSM